MTVDEERQDFITHSKVYDAVKKTCDKRRLIDKAYAATLLRNPVFNSNRMDKRDILKRGEFKRDFSNAVMKAAEKYGDTVSDEAHQENILQIKERVSQLHGMALIKARISIGTAQQCINIYLKHLWCAEEIPAPPHCPINSFVLEKAGETKAWRELEHIEDYADCINKLRGVAEKDGFASVAEWELVSWNKALREPKKK